MSVSVCDTATAVSDNSEDRDNQYHRHVERTCFLVFESNKLPHHTNKKMTNRSRKIPFKKAGRLNLKDRLRIEKERFAGDLDSAVLRLAHAVQQRLDIENDPWPSIAYWQTALVKVVRWFLNPQGLQFDPWDYVEQEERNTIKLVCDQRSQSLTRKTTTEQIFEFLVVDETSLKIIPTDMSLIDAVAVMESGDRIRLVSPDSFNVGKTTETSFGIMYLPKESVPNRVVYELIMRIRDRIRNENGGDLPRG